MPIVQTIRLGYIIDISTWGFLLQLSKESQNTFNALLVFLREEMDSLQRQMEEHTVTVHESMSSLTNTEEELAQLGLQNNISKPSTPLDNMVVENNNEAEQQQS